MWRFILGVIQERLLMRLHLLCWMLFLIPSCTSLLNMAHISFADMVCLCLSIFSAVDWRCASKLSHLAFLYSGFCRCFCLYRMGRILSSTNRQLLSDKPGRTLTWEIFDGMLLIIRSRVLAPLLVFQSVVQGFDRLEGLQLGGVIEHMDSQI